MTLYEIKNAVERGAVVHWVSEIYVVVRDRFGWWFIVCTVNQNAIGLTWLDGVTMNGRPDEFYLAGAR